ncbi:MAG TPA: hypothetical protein VHA10_07835 [Hypericibacter adhaerens]|uniref:hypothetical protein n=1 Tax=Hypericibacter adhaerens TaxID=2602016 RepID=UPI002C323BE7|nr:hypothetical protein [Hypericibacter adhaerens]HWA43105.1 hypothetical protein [Hypericibacter adhaerens]
MLLILLVAAMILVVLFVVGRAVANAKLATRELLELGSIEAPARLTPYAPDESPERVLFRFHRVKDSFLWMGSNTPYREALTVAVWPEGGSAGPDSGWEREFLSLATDRVEGIAWRQESDFRIGEGIHRVNTHETPSWVLVRYWPERHLALGYMIWKKDASLDQAKAMVERVAASFKPKLDLPAFFQIVRERPGKRLAARHEALAKQLASRNLAIEPDRPPVEQDGVAYVIQSDWPSVRGPWLFAMAPIGTLPATPRPYRHRWPPPPEGVHQWPDMIYYSWREGEGWAAKGVHGDYLVPEAMKPWLETRHTDRSKAYFYAVRGIAMDETDGGDADLERYWKALPFMAPKLADGSLVFELK